MMWVSFRIYWVSRITIIHQSYLDFNSQQAKVAHFGQKGTSGNPNGRNPYGFGGFILDKNWRKPRIRSFSSQQNITPKGSVLLEELRKTNFSTVVNEKVIYSISNLDILLLAYKFIKSSSKTKTLEENDQTFTTIDFKFLENISKNLKAGKFYFSSWRKITISKQDKNEIKLLGVTSLKDKIVQTAILLVFKAIFEPTFLNNFQGSQPGTAYHNSLKYLKREFKEVTWVIKGEISNCYDSIDHDILIKLIRKRINCDKTISLVKRILKSSFVDTSTLIKSTKGLNPESSLSFLFCNIYLHEFDLYLEKLKKSFNNEKLKKKNFQYLISKKGLNRKELLSLSKKLCFFISQHSYDLDFKKLCYIRYGNTFIIGIAGSKKECLKIRFDLKDFLNESLSLTLDLDRTHISHFTTDTIFFLGAFISTNKKKEKIVQKNTAENLTVKTRIISCAKILVPVEFILKKFSNNSFFKRKQSKRFVPVACRHIVNMNHADILNFYNKKIHTLLSHYFFVNNKKSLNLVIHKLKHSCALTLALKYKLRHSSKSFKKFGGTLQCPITKKKLCFPKKFAEVKKLSIDKKSFQYLLK